MSPVQRGLTAAQAAFLDEPHMAVVTTLWPDGSPHATVVWVDQVDGQVLFNTARGRVKDRHLQRDPRISILTIDGRDDHRWLSVSGRAELVDEGADEHFDRLWRKYLGPGDVRVPVPGQKRVIVRISVEHAFGEGVGDEA
jgi:PPOX class probable F420-dependent enzyme